MPDPPTEHTCHHQEGDADPGTQRMMVVQSYSSSEAVAVPGREKGAVVLSDRTLMAQVANYFLKHLP